MKVTLIECTPNMMEVLIFTKSTRLNLVPNMYEEIKSWPYEKKLEEIQYMANTIPSSWEFGDFIFCIEGVSRAFTHQFVRTRTNSYAQQTMRVLNMGEFDYVYSSTLSEAGRQRVNAVLEAIKGTYATLINMGDSIEDARGILPTNIATNITAKINLRTLSDMARSRTGGRTQEEYRHVMDAMIEAVLAVHPWAEVFLYPKGRGFFDDLETFARNHLGDWHRNALLKIIDKMRKAA